MWQSHQKLHLSDADAENQICVDADVDFALQSSCYQMKTVICNY